TIRVSIKFSYAHGLDIKEGLVQINFTDQGFHAGWYRHYDAPSLGLYQYEGAFSSQLKDQMKNVFAAGIDIRQSTLDAPSFVAEQARVRFVTELVGIRFDNTLAITRIDRVQSWSRGDMIMVRLDFTRFSITQVKEVPGTAVLGFRFDQD